MKTLEQEKYSDFKTASFLVIFAFVIKAVLFLLSDYSIDADGVGFLIMARQILHNDFLSIITPRHMLYPLAVAFLSRLIPDPVFCGILISLLVSSLIVIPVYFLARDIFGKKPAILSSIMVMVYPRINYFAYSVLSEPMYYFFITAAIGAFWFYLKQKKLSFLICTAFLFGMGYLTRPEPIGYFIMGLGALFILFLWRRKAFYVWHIAVFSAVFFLVILPHIIFLYYQTGFFLLTRYQNVLAMGMPAVKHRSIQDLKAFKPAMAYGYIFSHLNLFIMKWIKNLGEYVNFLPNIFPLPFILLAIIGIARKKETREIAPGVLFLVYFMLPTFFMASCAQFRFRYLYAILPIAMIFLGNGIVETQAWVDEAFGKREGGQPHLSKNIVLLLVFLFCFFYGFIRPVFYKQLKLQPVYDIESKDAALWVKKNMPAGYILLTNSDVTSFYAQRDFYDYSFDKDPIVLTKKFLSEGKKMYVSVAERQLRSDENTDYTQWLFLLDAKKTPELFKSVKVLNNYPHAKVIIYEVKQ